MPLPLVPAIGALAPLASSLIERVFPDPESRDKAKLALAEMEQTGEIKLIEAKLSAIIAEANSEDKWTSRARPTFLYVVYTIILAAIPMGVLHAVDPVTAANVAEGFKQWLAAIPQEMWWLFGTGFLGYTGAREYGKGKKTELAKWIIEKPVK